MASDRATSEFLGWYLNSALDLLRKAQHGVRHGITDARRVVVNPLEFVRGVFTGGAESAPPGVRRGAASAGAWRNCRRASRN